MANNLVSFEKVLEECIRTGRKAVLGAGDGWSSQARERDVDVYVKNILVNNQQVQLTKGAPLLPLVLVCFFVVAVYYWLRLSVSCCYSSSAAFSVHA